MTFRRSCKDVALKNYLQPTVYLPVPMLEGTWIRTKNDTFKVASDVLGYGTTK